MGKQKKTSGHPMSGGLKRPPTDGRRLVTRSWQAANRPVLLVVNRQNGR